MKAGDKFICIDNNFNNDKCDCGYSSPDPKLRQIVTLREAHWDGELLFYAWQEFPDQPCGCTIGYVSDNFRQLDEYLEHYSIEELIKTKEHVRKETK